MLRTVPLPVRAIRAGALRCMSGAAPQRLGARGFASEAAPEEADAARQKEVEEYRQYVNAQLEAMLGPKNEDPQKKATRLMNSLRNKDDQYTSMQKLLNAAYERFTPVGFAAPPSMLPKIATDPGHDYNFMSIARQSHAHWYKHYQARRQSAREGKAVDELVRESEAPHERIVPDPLEEIHRQMAQEFAAQQNTAAEDKKFNDNFSTLILNIGRTANVTSDGIVNQTRALVIVFTGHGGCGYGIGKGEDATEAIYRAEVQARKDMIALELLEGRTLPYPVQAKFHDTRVWIKPLPRHAGLTGSDLMKSVLGYLGVKDATAKIITHDNLYTMVHCMFKCFRGIQSHEVMERARGVRLTNLEDEVRKRRMWRYYK